MVNFIKRFASTLTLLGLLVLVVVPTRFMLHKAERYHPQARGMVLGLYANDPNFDYGEPLKRMASLGVRAASLQFIYYMDEFSSHEITQHPINSPTNENLRRTIRQARSLGMRVMIFPTLNLRNEAQDDKHWRGILNRMIGASGGPIIKPLMCILPASPRRKGRNGTR